jgi:hypothetical protein
MVPEPDLINQILETLSKTLSQCKNQRIPIFFVCEDLKDSLRSIYIQASDNLQYLFDSQPNENKVLFLACQMRDMKLKELTATRDSRALHEYFDELKQLFKIEMDCVQTLQTYKSVDIEHLIREPEVQYLKKFNFGYKKSDPKILSPIIKALCLRIDFLDQRTSADEFIRIVTSDNLDTIKEKIYLGCNTNEFKYCLKHFKDYFTSFRPSTIDKSGLFVSSGGNQITQGTINASRIETMQTTKAIDHIFRQKL